MTSNIPTDPNPSSNPKKRPAAPSSDPPSRPPKISKIYDARQILTKASDPALNNATGELNVASFVKAREFEIKALEQSIVACKKSAALRTFQQVPREMRRRTASHNVRRMPKRLRARAAKEVCNTAVTLEQWFVDGMASR